MLRLLIVLTLCNHLIIAQSYLAVSNDNQMNDTVYQAISKYEIIWIGEIHGAKEPALITESFVNLLLKHNKKVTLALEIPKDKINQPNSRQDSASLRRSHFFDSGKYGNRATKSWFNLILHFISDKNVSTVYFDEDTSSSDSERDSLMARHLFAEWDRNTVLVVLSGNLHNMLEMRKGQKKAALYLAEIAKGNIRKEKILALNHTFVKGQILASYVGEDMKLKEYDYTNTAWANQNLYKKNHLFIYAEPSNGWNGHFFTRTVEAAELVK